MLILFHFSIMSTANLTSQTRPSCSVPFQKSQEIRDIIQIEKYDNLWSFYLTKQTFLWHNTVGLIQSKPSYLSGFKLRFDLEHIVGDICMNEFKILQEWCSAFSHYFLLHFLSYRISSTCNSQRKLVSITPWKEI